MKTINIILAVLFLTFAALQFNDDPDDIWFWIIIYSTVGIISAFAAFKRYNMQVLVLAIGVILYQMFRMFPAFTQWISMGMPSITGEMKAISPHVELVREFLGLCVCLIVIIYHYITFTRIRKSLQTEKEII